MLLDHLSSDRVLLAGFAREKRGVLRELAEMLAEGSGDDFVQPVLAGLTDCPIIGVPTSAAFSPTNTWAWRTLD